MRDNFRRNNKAITKKEPGNRILLSLFLLFLVMLFVLLIIIKAHKSSHMRPENSQALSFVQHNDFDGSDSNYAENKGESSKGSGAESVGDLLNGEGDGGSGDDVLLPESGHKGSQLETSGYKTIDEVSDKDRGYLSDELKGILNEENSNEVEIKVAAFMRPRPEKDFADTYKIRVFVKEQYVGVFTDPEGDGGFRSMVLAFACSTADTSKGHKTPHGKLKIGDKHIAGYMIDGSYGRYCSHIEKYVMLHSMPSYGGSTDRGISLEDWNKLGSEASHGCVRLAFRDAYWIHEHCPRGTNVEVLDDRGELTNLPESIPALKMPQGAPSWDPSDPNPENPFVADPSILYVANN